MSSRYTSRAGALALAAGASGSVVGFWLVLGALLALGSPQLSEWNGRAIVVLALAPLIFFAVALALRPAWFATRWWIADGALHFLVPSRGGGWTRAVPAHGFAVLDAGAVRVCARRVDGSALSLPRWLRDEHGQIWRFRVHDGALVIVREDSRPG